MSKSLNVRRLIMNVGGRSGISPRLVAAGFKAVALGVIDKWMQRNSLPTGRLVQILIVARDEGRPVNLYDYIEEARKDEANNVRQSDQQRGA